MISVSPLRAAHGKLFTENGRIQLKGLSLFWPNLQPRFFNPQVISWIAKDWHANVIRVPLGNAARGATIGHRRLLEMAYPVLDSVIRAGLYAIVDCHSHDRPDVTGMLLEEIAANFKDTPNLIYEPWNEPHAAYSWPEIAAFHREAIDVIRAHAPNALVVVGTPNYSQRVDLAAQAPIARPNLAYSLHFYAGTHREGLRQLARQAMAQGLTLIATEWGMSEADGDGVLDLHEATRWLDFLDSADISHVAWAISSERESSALLRTRASSTGRWGTWSLTAAGRFLRRRLRANHRPVRS
jgi:endoglucanase